MFFIPLVLFAASLAAAAPATSSPVDQTTHTFSNSSSPVYFNYGGGRVLANPEITPIWYNVTKELQDDLIKYYKAIVTSAWMDIFTEYNTPTQTIGKGSVLPAINYEGKIQRALDDFIDIREIIRQMVREGTINPNQNSYYAFHVSPYTNVTQYDLTICYSGLGAYHGCAYSADISTLDCVPYGVIASCYFDDNPNTADSVAHGASHEFAESVTDADPGTGWVATIDGAGGIELADYCGGPNIPQDNAYGFVTDPSNQKWAVSGLWSGADQRCVVGKPKNPITRKPTTPKKDTVNAKINYGSPLQSIEITPIFYGPNVTYSSEMADYYNFIASSSYLDLLAEYSSTPMGRGKSLPPRFESTAMTTSLDAEDDIQAYLTNLISQGTLKPNTNSFYAIHVSPQIKVTRYGDNACNFGCAQSLSFNVSVPLYTGNLRYAVFPNNPKCVKLKYCSDSGTDPLANLQSLSSIHIVDAVTDFVRGTPSGWQIDADTGLSWKCYENYQYHQAPLFDAKNVNRVVNKVWSNKYQD
ncbi:hypothetical protein HDU79_002840, partial [Rhizoclosmatium sp. JEL0117]